MGKLKRNFGFWSSCALVISNMVGSGIFISPGQILADTENFYYTLLIWIGAGIVALSSALCYLELSLLIPKDGGPYHYIANGTHKYMGYLYIWMNAVFTRPASVAIGAVSFSGYITDLEGPKLQIGILTIILWTLLVQFSTKWSKYAINLFSFAKFAVLFIIAFLGLYVFWQQDWTFKDGVDYYPDDKSKSSFTSWTLFAAFWAFDGWDALSYYVEEIDNPEMVIPKVTWLMTPCITVMYCLVNIAYNIVLSPTQFATSNSLVADFGQAVLGSFGRNTMLVLYSMCVFGMGISTLMSSSRLTMTAAIDDEDNAVKALLWRPLGFLHISFNTPLLSIYLTSAMAILLTVAFRDFDKLTAIFGWAAWVFYFCQFLAVLTLRYYKEDYKHVPRQYQVPLPLVAISLLASLTLIIVPLIDNKSYVIFGSTLILAFIGMAWYIIWLKFKRKKWFCKYNDGLVELMQKLFCVAP